MITTEIWHHCLTTGNNVHFTVNLPAVPNVGNGIVIPHETNDLIVRVEEVRFTANSNTVTVYCIDAHRPSSISQLSEDDYYNNFISWFKGMGANPDELNSYKYYLDYLPKIQKDVHLSKFWK
jgi:hypothetical protein